MGWKKKEEIRVPGWMQAEGIAPLRPKPKTTPWKPAFLFSALVALVASAVLFCRVDQKGFAEWLRTSAQLVWNWSPTLLSAFLFIGIAAALLLWKLPKWQVARSKALTDEKRFDRENEARKTLAQIIGGLFVIGSLFSATRTLEVSQQQAATAAQQLQIEREGQITDRFTKAIDQLGASDGNGKPKLEIRLGGIYALERIAHDSERDHGPIMEVLTGYVRAQSPSKRMDNNVPRVMSTLKTQLPTQGNVSVIPPPYPPPRAAQI